MLNTATGSLPRSTPEAVGIPSASLIGFLDGVRAAKLELHSLMVVRHGKVCAEGWWKPYSADQSHLVYSLSKSFTSTAIGMLVDAGQLGLDDKVASFFPDKMPVDPSANLLAMRVRDLLSMSAGQEADPLFDLNQRTDGDWVQSFLASPVENEPGTKFRYSTSATYMLSAIVQKVSGETTLAFLQKRLFEPLGVGKVEWPTCPHGISLGGTGICVTTETIAKLGQLYLQKGVWEGQRLLSVEWVETASSAHISNGDDPKSDWAQGYGFQFWRCLNDCYRGDGAFGQYCIVDDRHDAVIAITSSLGDMQAVLNLVWTHVFPAYQEPALPENSLDADELRVRLWTLEIAGPQGLPHSEAPTNFAGTYESVPGSGEELLRLQIEFRDHGTVLFTTDSKSTQRWEIGIGEWIENHVSFPWNSKALVAAQGVWQDELNYLAVVKDLESPLTVQIACRFEGDEVYMSTSYSGHFRSSTGPAFRGRRSEA